MLWIKSRRYSSIGGSSDERGHISGSEDDRHPLLQVRYRPVLTLVFPLAECFPLGVPIRRCWQSFFEQADDYIFGRVELPVRTHQEEPCAALDQQRHQRKYQNPCRKCEAPLPRCPDRGEDRRVEREEECVRQTSSRADPVGHLDVELVLLQNRGAILFAVGLAAGSVPHGRAYILNRCCSSAKVFLEDQGASITASVAVPPRDHRGDLPRVALLMAGPCCGYLPCATLPRLCDS